MTSWTVAHQAPPSMGFPRQYWSGLPFPLPGDLPHPGIEPTSPALAGGFFITEPSPILNYPLPNPQPSFAQSCPFITAELSLAPHPPSTCIALLDSKPPQSLLSKDPGEHHRTAREFPWSPFYLCGASVLRTEYPAVFGDSSDPQRAARPQRKACCCWGCC